MLMDMKKTGFCICTFPPDRDPCEKCGKTFQQLYFRRTPCDCLYGEYWCLGCIQEEYKANQEFDKSIEIKAREWINRVLQT